MKKGDKLICLNTIKNVLGLPLFKEGEIYEILYIDSDEITLNHVLYANEFLPYSVDWVLKNFKKIN